MRRRRGPLPLDTQAGRLALGVEATDEHGARFWECERKTLDGLIRESVQRMRDGAPPVLRIFTWWEHGDRDVLFSAIATHADAPGDPVKLPSRCPRSMRAFMQIDLRRVHSRESAE